MNTPTHGRVAVGDRVTLFQRGRKKIWTAEFHQAGQHRRKSMRTANYKVAHAQAMKLEVDLREGTHRPTPAAITIDAACQEHAQYLILENRAAKTKEAYAGALDRWMTFLARQHVIRLNQITGYHFDRFRTERGDACKPMTVYLDANLIKAFMRWAKSRQLLTNDPLVDVRVKRPPLVTKFCPTLGQVDALLAVAPEPFRTLWATLAFTGMRAGDLARLRPQDIDWDDNWIHLVSRPGAETKTRQSRRVPIHPRLRPILDAVPKSTREFVFTKSPESESPITPRYLNDKLQKLLPTISLPAGRESGMVVHSLRHFFETQAVNSGVPQIIIDRWLGHTPDPTVMSNVYYDLNEDVSQEKMRLVDFGKSLLIDSPEAVVAPDRE